MNVVHNAFHTYTHTPTQRCLPSVCTLISPGFFFCSFSLIAIFHIQLNPPNESTNCDFWIFRYRRESKLTTSAHELLRFGETSSEKCIREMEGTCGLSISCWNPTILKLKSFTRMANGCVCWWRMDEISIHSSSTLMKSESILGLRTYKKSIDINAFTQHRSKAKAFRSNIFPFLRTIHTLHSTRSLTIRCHQWFQFEFIPLNDM